MTYYAVQVYSPSDHNTTLDRQWRTMIDSWSTLTYAKKVFKDLWMNDPYRDYRIVKAFYHQVSSTELKEIVTEILDCKKGTPW